MAWYKTGTISVTNGSATVTGSGTSWVANAEVGEALYAPDGRLYEITNIASDTSMTITPAYLGSNQTGQSYTIVPSQSYIRDLAAQAADLVNNYSTIANTIGVGKFPDGTLADPAFKFSDDLDTGFYRSADNEVTFVAGGVAQFKYDANGLTLLNGSQSFTTIDATNLEVTNLKAKDGTAAATIADSTGVVSLSANPVLSSGTANGVLYLNGSKVATSGSGLTFDGTNLGVGTASPSVTFQVAGRIRLADANRLDWGNGNEYIVGDNGGAVLFGVAASEQMRLTSTGLGIGTSSPTQKLDVRNGIALIRPTVSTGAVVDALIVGQDVSLAANPSAGNGARIYLGGHQQPLRMAAIEGVVSAGTNGHHLAFLTNANGSAPTERMRIDSSGNVGIGTSSPSPYLTTKVLHISDANGGSFRFGTATEQAILACTSSEITLGTGQSLPIKFLTNALERLRITSTGNVGIGTSSPDGKLHIEGGALRVSGTKTSGSFLDVVPSNTGSDGVSLSCSFYGSGAYGPIKFATGGTERLRIFSGGQFSVGTTSILEGATGSSDGTTIYGSVGRVVISANDDRALELRRRTANGETAQFYRDTTKVGSISVTTTATSYNTSSDYRLKENVAPMQNALATVAQLNPVTYTWKADGSAGQGFIAHELQAVVPDAVTGEKDAVDEEGNPQYQGVDTSFLVATLTKAIQELNAKVEALEAQLNSGA